VTTNVALVPRAGKTTLDVIVHDAPEVACDEFELVLVGVVAGDCRVVLVVEELEAEAPEEVVAPPVATDEVDPPEIELPAAVARPVVPLPAVLEVLTVVAVVAVVACWGSAASAANNPTPATEPAATHPVALRLRRNQVLRNEGVVMGPSKAGLSQCPLSVPSMPRYRFLSARWERTTGGAGAQTNLEERGRPFAYTLHQSSASHGVQRTAGLSLTQVVRQPPGGDRTAKFPEAPPGRGRPLRRPARCSTPNRGGWAPCEAP
jgi:hypothetical protein